MAADAQVAGRTRLRRADEVWLADVGGGQLSLVIERGRTARCCSSTRVAIQEFIGDGHQVVSKHLTTNTRCDW
jgi:hypothetical protein